MALFGQDQVDPRIAAGGTALGDLIAGGPGERGEKVYVDQLRKNFDAADAMWQARDRRARAIAREGIRGSVDKAGYAPNIAPLVGDILTTSDSPNIRNLGDFANPADMAIEEERRKAMEAGDIPRYNRLTAVATDKAYQPARVVGGNVLPDGVGLGDSLDMVPLPQTQARIDDGRARTEAAVAKTNRAPAPHAGKTLSEPEAEAKMAFIAAKANEMSKPGKDGKPKHSKEYVDAWVKSEAMKAGVAFDGDWQDAPEALGDTVPSGAAAPSVEAKHGYSQDEVLQAISDARRAIASGLITKDAAAARLRKAGLERAAGRL